MPQEPRLGLLDVRHLDQRQPAGEGDGAVTAEQRADPVQGERADDRARGGPEQRGDQAHLSGARRETGERQDHLARQRREEVLQRDGEAGAGGAQRVHEVGDPLGCGRRGCHAARLGDPT
ncbi:hypothetical protein STRTUCAR8_03421 [Streptomyces turgidiscabies Car8]|uniref:Uncharacterized protein n=1 Tax=Streptomyces turgidiscabies (strain Car8) TaxID=698760 RepID=L7EUA4_STRT8|nr:hypothetical protein STRTUCAR8_03421 [Streptomyces turgidiscabies Car8]